jgi:pimeloyl-ACP methyl ester carboxylesterase
MGHKNDRYIDVYSIWTRYWDLGAGPPVLLLHGLGASAESWEPVAGPLSRHFRVLIPDLIGFGFTDKPDIDYTLEAFVGFVGAFMQSLDIARASLIGHSLGGAIALRIAIEHPEWVDRLAVADTAGLAETPGTLIKLLRTPLIGEVLLTPSRSKTRQALKLYFHDQSLVTDDLVEFNYRLISQPGAKRAYLSTIRNAVSTSDPDLDLKTLVADQLDQIEAPTLVLWGQEDQLAPMDSGEVAANVIPHAELHIIPDAGHNPMVEQPDHFTQAVLDFLAPLR